MVEKSKRRTETRPGLGDSDSGLRPKHAPPTNPPTSGVRDRDGDGDGDAMSDAPPPFSGEVPLERAAKISTRRSRPSPIRVDDVGDTAVAIATKAVQTSAPRLLKTRSELTNAPLDHRDAFVISLIDGKLSVQALVDVSGMPASEIIAILERLARIGIVSLP